MPSHATLTLLWTLGLSFRTRSTGEPPMFKATSKRLGEAIETSQWYSPVNCQDRNRFDRCGQKWLDHCHWLRITYTMPTKTWEFLGWPNPISSSTLSEVDQKKRRQTANGPLRIARCDLVECLAIERIDSLAKFGKLTSLGWWFPASGKPKRFFSALKTILNRWISYGPFKSYSANGWKNWITCKKWIIFGDLAIFQCQASGGSNRTHKRGPPSWW